VLARREGAPTPVVRLFGVQRKCIKLVRWECVLLARRDATPTDVVCLFGVQTKCINLLDGSVSCLLEGSERRHPLFA